jgi:uncharacterized protein (TIGR02147 family)
MEIFNSSDYRKIVKNWIEKRPSKGRGENLKMSQFLSIPASVFSQTLAGSRDLSPDHAFRLADYMGLLPLEKEYFITLVQIEKAAHHEYKKFLKTKLAQLKDQSTNLSKRVSHEKSLSPEDQQEFYSSWIYSGIRLRCSIGKGASQDDILNDFKISKNELTKILDFLLRTGLVIQEKSLYKMGPQRTFVGRESPMVTRHHLNWRIKSLEKAPRLSESELMFTGPLTCSDADYELIREKLANVIKEISEIVKDSPAEKLAYFGVDFFST